jgi:hypothetical protein
MTSDERHGTGVGLAGRGAAQTDFSAEGEYRLSAFASPWIFFLGWK